MSIPTTPSEAIAILEAIKLRPPLEQLVVYYAKVERLLQAATTREEAIAVLSYIGSELQKGTFMTGGHGKFPF